MSAPLEEHLFRREAGRMVAALTRVFGVQNLALAEDVVQDAFCRAAEVWKVRGVPENPAAWLMATAKHRALDVVRRERTASAAAPLVREEELEAAFEPEVIRDEQLRMMFSCCHPRLPEEAQVALVLNVLCGFGAREIAAAYLSGIAAVEKRIARGKAVLAKSTALFDLGDAQFGERLSAVHRALYLLFNEGYHGASEERPVRLELCEEAMRLVALLREHAATATPVTHALAALMCLHAARLPARMNASGDLNALDDQDRARWDRRLIGEGVRLLEQSATGDVLSAYHVEAAIAAEHASAPSFAQTDWAAVVALYDQLLAVAPSPVVELNRAIAVGQRDGPEAGLRALHEISDSSQLEGYFFYPAAFGELELKRGARDAAAHQFRLARALARNDAERRFIDRRLEAIRTQP